MEVIFSPEYPNQQKTIDNEEWTLFVKSKCIVTADAFIKVMNQWVKDPQNVTPPILRAEIIKEDTNEIKENDYTVIKQIRRKIVSRQNRDRNIVQDVKFIKYDNGEYRVIHTPVFDDEVKSYSDFPYYFPPLKKFSYGIIPITNNKSKEKIVENTSNDAKIVENTSNDAVTVENASNDTKPNKTNNDTSESDKIIDKTKTENKDQPKIKTEKDQDETGTTSQNDSNTENKKNKTNNKGQSKKKNAKINNYENIENLAYIYLEIIPIEEEISERMKKIYTRLLKMLFKHCKGTMNGYKKRVIHDVIIPKILYQDTYYQLKQKYGKYWVEHWPEDTDPQKHVFEDIGIATWLKLLWNDDKEKTSFIDIGCGNGLLTNLLTKEGFKGYGIDISKRKVWDIYDKDVKLEERFISPQTQVFDDGTWLIGNHPDEMTLWIPIMASKSGYNSKFVLIPCCFFELTGGKFTGKGYNQEKMGRYHCYLERVRQVMKDCGYVVEEETLRIPSTKNVALIGRKRTFREDDEEEHNRIQKRIKTWIDDVEASGEFKLRTPDNEKQKQLLAKRLARKAH